MRADGLTAPDYRLDPATETLRVKVACGCGARSIGFQLAALALAPLRRAALAPDAVVGSWYCRDCKELVKVTAAHLHLAA